MQLACEKNVILERHCKHVLLLISIRCFLDINHASDHLYRQRLLGRYLEAILPAEGMLMWLELLDNTCWTEECDVLPRSVRDYCQCVSTFLSNTAYPLSVPDH